ncbi:MAG: hypothetical protein KDE24_35435, partial [Caldilinea sp.]|nr:hypothetical protein [Caldilinea sp.]
MESRIANDSSTGQADRSAPADAVRHSAHGTTFTIPEGAPPAFHLLAKPTGAICNLDCAYYFFLYKEVFYPGSKFRMSDDVLEAYIRQLIE